MIHYHGTPLTPAPALLTMAGRHFCVPYPRPDDLSRCLRVGASVMLDNGAFSTWTRGVKFNEAGFYRWASPHLRHPHWVVIPDVIGGSDEDNDAMLARCKLPPNLAAPVWHTCAGLDRLRRLADAWPRVCFGSTSEFKPGSDAWKRRMDQAWGMLQQTGRYPWVHMLRAMEQASTGPWPFASADSTNIARNFKGCRYRPAKEPEDMAAWIDAKNPKTVYGGKK